jgi:hypothetical protein
MKVTTESDHCPEPQQAETRGQLVVHRTDSEQESSLYTTTTTAEQPPTTTTTTTAEQRPTTTSATTTTTDVEIISISRTRKPREVSFQEPIILYKEYSPS